MIRWCAYCQRYQGEVAPFENYSVTHTLCESCEASGAYLHEQPRTLERIQSFFTRVGRGGTGPGVTATEVVQEGAALGLDPIDLLLGIVQPVLRQIGARWERAEATIAEEHRISALCAGVTLMLLESDPRLAELRHRRPPQVLLVAAEGNQHTIGLQILEVLLLRNHVSTVTAYPGLPDDEVVEITRSLRPRVLAISAAVPQQMGSAIAVAHRIGDWPPSERPRVVVGGMGLRCGEPLPVPSDGSVSVCTDVGSLIELAATA
jgi:methanogenic corrinoid protein MtbC1